MIPHRWDIFCNVIDNFGDIGVTWRLARALAAEHGLAVRLWVDDLTPFVRLCPEARGDREIQQIEGVEVRRWTADWVGGDVAGVVIEGFGCALPESCLAAMAQRSPAPVWINLEYLSAEGWVEGCHGLASPHPRLPLVKHFFFPGYTAATGGLIREADYPARRAAFEAPAFWQRLGLRPPGASTLCVSLFAYADAPVAPLLEVWAAGAQPVRCLVPEGQAAGLARCWAGLDTAEAGTRIGRGALELVFVPFLPQRDYDALLWACDLNFVRGEDSCVRAQLAGKPMVWQVYPQTEAAHIAKLEALLGQYTAFMAPDAKAPVTAFWRAWNAVPSSTGTDWHTLWRDWDRARAGIGAGAAAWARRLHETESLVTKLVAFVEARLK